MNSYGSVTDLRSGQHVLSLDYCTLGRVDEVHPAAFSVMSAATPTFWLHRDAIFTVCESSVTLLCNRNRVARYWAAEPDLAVPPADVFAPGEGSLEPAGVEGAAAQVRSLSVPLIGFVWPVAPILAG